MEEGYSVHTLETPGMPLNLKAPIPHTSIGDLFVGNGFPLLRAGVHTGLALVPTAAK